MPCRNPARPWSIGRVPFLPEDIALKMPRVGNYEGSNKGTRCSKGFESIFATLSR